MDERQRTRVIIDIRQQEAHQLVGRCKTLYVPLEFDSTAAFSTVFVCDKLLSGVAVHEVGTDILISNLVILGEVILEIQEPLTL